MRAGIPSPNRQLPAPSPFGLVPTLQVFDPFSLSSNDALLSIRSSPRHRRDLPRLSFPRHDAPRHDASSSCNSTDTELSKKTHRNLFIAGSPFYRLDGNRRTVGPDLAILSEVPRFSARAEPVPSRQVVTTPWLTYSYIDYPRCLAFECQHLLAKISFLLVLGLSDRWR